MRLNFIHTINFFFIVLLIFSSINCASNLKTLSKRKYDDFLFEKSRSGEIVPIILKVNVIDEKRSVELVCVSNRISSSFYSGVDTTDDLISDRLESVLLKGQKISIDSYQLAQNPYMIINDSFYSNIESMKVSDVEAMYFDSLGFMAEERMSNGEINAVVKYFYKKRLLIIVGEGGFYQIGY